MVAIYLTRGHYKKRVTLGRPPTLHKQALGNMLNTSTTSSVYKSYGKIQQNDIVINLSSDIDFDGHNEQAYVIESN